MPMDKEIEIQVQIENASNLIEFLNTKAKFTGEKHQVDKYYIPFHRDFLQVRPVKEWLRLRDSSGKFSINYKNWVYDENGKSNYCHEHETIVADMDQMEKILKALDMKEIVVVDKVRKTFMFEDYEIAIDSVKGLGDFVEIEFKGETGNKTESEITDEMVLFLDKINCGKITRNYRGYPYQLLFPEK